MASAQTSSPAFTLHLPEASGLPSLKRGGDLETVPGNSTKMAIRFDLEYGEDGAQ